MKLMAPKLLVFTLLSLVLLFNKTRKDHDSSLVSGTEPLLRVTSISVSLHSTQQMLLSSLTCELDACQSSEVMRVFWIGSLVIPLLFNVRLGKESTCGDDIVLFVDQYRVWQHLISNSSRGMLIIFFLNIFVTSVTVIRVTMIIVTRVT